MGYDFQKEFAKKNSANFWRRRSKGVKPEILIPSGNNEHTRALTIEQVVRLINSSNPQSAMALLAQELGCSNVHCADFRVEAWNVTDDWGDAYDPYDVNRDFYFLIAVEK